MQTTGYAQLGSGGIKQAAYDARAQAGANQPVSTETELAQILNKLGRINEVLAGNTGVQHAFISRVAPWLHAPDAMAQKAMPEPSGLLSAINNQLELLGEKLAEQTNLTSYLGRIG